MGHYRFYADNLCVGEVILDQAESQHARRSLRLQAGQSVQLFDGNGQVADGVVASVTPQTVISVLQVQEIAPIGPRITVACAVPKGDRLHTLVEKLSELGADRFIPLHCERSVVEPRQNKLEKLRRIALESAKQCGRAWLLAIDSLTKFETLVSSPGDELKWIADVPQATGSEATVSIETLPSNREVLILIGPEGGWSEQERELARKHGFVPWQFNTNVLRVETAAIAAVAILRGANYTEA